MWHLPQVFLTDVTEKPSEKDSLYMPVLWC